ncbi:MAG: MFS transporter [Candidatus Bathyarchaeia archaeon]
MEHLEEGSSFFWFVTDNIKVLMACRVLWSWSTSIVYPFFSLYILALGGTSREVGLINSLGILAGMILYPVGGYIADRSGRVKLIGYSTALYAASHLFFAFAQNWQMVALGQFLGQLFLFYMPAMNALEADSLPAGARGRGFAVIMAVPGAVRIIAPSIGGWLIEWYQRNAALSNDQALVQAVRLAWMVATVTGFVVAAIRLRYLKETVDDDGMADPFRWRDIPRVIKESYRSIGDSVRWMSSSLRMVVGIEMLTAFFIAMSAPFYVVYAKQVIGISEYQWGLVMLISGFIGITLAFPMGSLVDRIGAKKMILVGMGMAPLVLFSYQYAGGFAAIALILSIVSIINNIMRPAFSTLIADIIPRSRRGRLYSLIGERGVTISFGNFWGGGFLLFMPAAIGSYIGGEIYVINPALPTIITAASLGIAFILILMFVEEPTNVEQ